MAIKVFKWFDFLTFGLLGVIVTAVATYAEVAPSDITTQGRVLMALVGVLSWAPYAITLYFRGKGKGAP
jgi:hypothetical protein